MKKLILYSFAASFILNFCLPFGLFAQLSESFDNNSIPVGWSNTNSSANIFSASFWQFSGTPGFAMATTQDHTGNGGSYAWIDGSWPDSLTSILETDAVSMVGLVNPELRFWLKSDITGYTTTFNDFSVDIYDGTVWHNSALTFANNTANQDWEQFVVPLSGYNFTGPARFRFNVGQFGSVAYYNDIALDDVEVVSVLDNDAGLTTMLTPNRPECTADSVVTVVLINHGLLNLTSTTVNWSINGVTQTPYLWTGNLAQNGLDSVVVGTNNAIAFGDTIEVWTSLPNGVTDSAGYNDSVMLKYIAGYSGTMLIDPSGGGDFLSFTDAMNKLEEHGICGDLTIEAVDATYFELIELPQITGLDSNTSLTFRSQSGNRDNVVLTYTSTSFAQAYVVKIEAKDNISFEDMTIWNQGLFWGSGLHIVGCDSVTINNCVVKSNHWTSSGGRTINLGSLGSNSCDYFTLTNSVIEGGYYGLYFQGNSNNFAEGAHIENNHFLDASAYGAYMNLQKNIHFSDNHFTSILNTGGSIAVAMYFNNVNNGDVIKNHVKGTADWPIDGIYLNNCNGSLTEWLNISNNRIYLPSSSASSGISLFNDLFTESANNSIYINGGAAAKGVHLSNGSYNNLFNNIVAVDGFGTAVYIDLGLPVYQMDYNNLSAPNGNVGHNNGYHASLPLWTANTMFDSNSLSVNPVYSDTATLKVCTDSLFGMGMPLSHVMYDYEGEPRQSPPCIGADEFVTATTYNREDTLALCDADTLPLNQFYFDTVVWNGTDTANRFNVTQNAQSITLMAVGGCGIITDTIYIKGQQYAQVTDTVKVCENMSLTLDAGVSNASYLWSNGDTTFATSINAGQLLWVEVTDTGGCLSSDTVNIVQSYNVQLPDSTFFCENDSVNLAPGADGFYEWNNQTTDSQLVVSQQGYYSVTVTDANCVSSDTVHVREVLFPDFCIDMDIEFQTVEFFVDVQPVDGNYSYLWEFKDEDTSTVMNPIHVFMWTNNDFTYDYVINRTTLTITNECGSYVSTPYNFDRPTGASFFGEYKLYSDTVWYQGPYGFYTFGDGDTITTQNPVHVYPAGFASTAQEWENEITNVATLQIFGCSPDSVTGSSAINVSVNELQGNSSLVNIFPNPTQNQFNIQPLGNGTNMQVMLFDSKGARVLSKQFEDVNTNQTYAVQMHTLPKGMYLVHIIIDDKPMVYKITKL